ncbi:hypothetical protein [Microbacterium terregens]|uniref:Uncharacterized protein n=1 Tax=Microbacterium terregens TaxID=69363 RepID=A0ABV5SYL0_9MICO
MAESPEKTQARFLELLRRALMGWQDKVDNDFSVGNSSKELASLESDPVYAQFGLASNGYVLIRLMGRMSISIGRRLGELYDNLPKYVAAARFGLTPSDVAAKIVGLNLDVCIPFSLLTEEDRVLALAATEAATGQAVDPARRGLGIEIRYNFNPNDSARLRKDVAMAEGLIAEGLVPIYLVFSGISPRAEAIARLKRAGWLFLIADDAAAYTKELLGLDLSSLLSSESVQAEVRAGTDGIMSAIVGSVAMKNALSDYPPENA